MLSNLVLDFGLSPLFYLEPPFLLPFCLAPPAACSFFLSIDWFFPSAPFGIAISGCNLVELSN
jgi:hypothetical protein